MQVSDQNISPEYKVKVFEEFSRTLKMFHKISIFNMILFLNITDYLQNIPTKVLLMAPSLIVPLKKIMHFKESY